MSKGLYVFRQDEASTHFYGILKGIISIRINKVDTHKRNEIRRMRRREELHRMDSLGFNTKILIENKKGSLK